MAEINIALNQLKIDEGLRLQPYRCTADKLTIGYGRNLEDVGITSAEAELMLANDIKDAVQDAQVFSGSAWSGLTPARKAVIINMAFNLGLSRLRQFKRFQQQLKMGRYDQAAIEMLDSRWAQQVKGRALRLADQMRTG